MLPSLSICSSQSIPSDPALSFVISHLGAHTEVAAQQQQPTALTPGSSGGSGALELRSEARVWEVQWQELKLQRLLGRGSFGSVYLAEWNQVPVAVKMLGGKGERGRQDCMESMRGCNGGGQHDWTLPHTRPAVIDSSVCLACTFYRRLWPRPGPWPAGAARLATARAAGRGSGNEPHAPPQVSGSCGRVSEQVARQSAVTSAGMHGLTDFYCFPASCSIVQFMGLVVVPPAIITGMWECSSAPCSVAVLVALQYRLWGSDYSLTHRLLVPFVPQNTAAGAACTTAWRLPASRQQPLTC